MTNKHYNYNYNYSESQLRQPLSTKATVVSESVQNCCVPRSTFVPTRKRSSLVPLVPSIDLRCSLAAAAFALEHSTTRRTEQVAFFTFSVSLPC